MTDWIKEEGFFFLSKLQIFQLPCLGIYCPIDQIQGDGGKFRSLLLVN